MLPDLPNNYLGRVYDECASSQWMYLKMTASAYDIHLYRLFYETNLLVPRPLRRVSLQPKLSSVMFFECYLQKSFCTPCSIVFLYKYNVAVVKKQ